jgi:hypothetical protein
VGAGEAETKIGGLQTSAEWHQAVNVRGGGFPRGPIIDHQAALSWRPGESRTAPMAWNGKGSRGSSQRRNAGAGLVVAPDAPLSPGKPTCAASQVDVTLHDPQGNT